MELLTDFANDNEGLWALVALPFAIMSAFNLGARAVARLGTAVRSKDRNLSLLRKQVRRRVEIEIEERLVLGSMLETKLQPSRASGSISAPELYAMTEAGAQALIVGTAGSGKSMLGLRLVEHSVERSSADPTSPLMGVVSLRDWRWFGTGRGNNWKGLLAWTARRLSRAYPTFGTAYFTQLLREHRFIPCLDGLDEMSPSARKEAVSALASYAAAGFPLVVLSRDPSVVSNRDPDEVDCLTSRFDHFNLLPPSDAALAGVADWPAWEQFIANARQPHRAAALIGNPLQLSVAALTWSHSERPDALASSDDPEAELWDSFFARRLGDRPVGKDSSSLRQLAGWIALAAAQRGSSTFRPFDLYASSIASAVALAIMAAPVLAFAWHDRVLGVGIIGVLALAWALGLIAPTGLEELTRRLARRGGEKVETVLFFGLQVLTAVAIILAGNVLASLLGESQPETTTPAWLHSVYLALVFASLLTYIVASDLRFRDGLGWLLSSPLYLAITIGLAVFIADFYFSSAYYALAAASLFLCFLCPLLGRTILTAERRVPRSGLRGACRDLARVGVLTGGKDVYRFRHGVISRKLGEETLDDLAKANKLARLSTPSVAAGFVDSRINPAALERADRLTAGLFAECGRDQLVVANRMFYLYFGALRPQDALPVLSSFLRRRSAHSAARVHLAELFDALQRRDEAASLWAEVFAIHSEADWILNKWVRRQSLLGDREEAFRHLRTRVRGADTAENAFPRLLLAELQGRFGDDDEVPVAIESLEQIRLASDRHLVHRATLELARLRAELFDECEQAEGLLREIPESEFDGLKYARLAQLRYVAGDHSEAEQLGREASSLLCWDEDPTFQLETLLTTARVCEELAPEAQHRAMALSRFSWSLPGRDSDRLSAARFDGLLLDLLNPDAVAGPSPG